MRLHKEYSARQVCSTHVECPEPHVYLCPVDGMEFHTPEGREHYPFCSFVCVDRASNRQGVIGQQARRVLAEEQSKIEEAAALAAEKELQE